MADELLLVLIASSTSSFWVQIIIPLQRNEIWVPNLHFNDPFTVRITFSFEVFLIGNTTTVLFSFIQSKRHCSQVQVKELLLTKPIR